MAALPPFLTDERNVLIMVDFQDNGLSSQVYELIYKMHEFIGEDELPKFVTTHFPDGTWKTELTVPGVIIPASGYGDTEIESINKCATYMLFSLDKKLNKKQKDNEYNIILNTCDEQNRSLFRNRNSDITLTVVLKRS